MIAFAGWLLQKRNKWYKLKSNLFFLFNLFSAFTKRPNLDFSNLETVFKDSTGYQHRVYRDGAKLAEEKMILRHHLFVNRFSFCTTSHLCSKCKKFTCYSLFKFPQFSSVTN